MRTLVIFPVFLALSMAMPSKDSEVVNEMLDLVESGLDRTKDREGRLIFVRLTLTQQSNTQVTETTTTTIMASCVNGTFTECTSDASASARSVGYSNEEAKNMFPEAIVTKANGNTVDISTILPSKVEPAGRSGIEFLDVDGVIGKTMQSGSLSWKELEMLEPMTPCSRSSKDRKPRVVQILNEEVTETTTTTITETETAGTVAFGVELKTCTAAGFEFGPPLC